MTALEEALLRQLAKRVPFHEAGVRIASQRGMVTEGNYDVVVHYIADLDRAGNRPTQFFILSDIPGGVAAVTEEFLKDVQEGIQKRTGDWVVRFTESLNEALEAVKEAT